MCDATVTMVKWRLLVWPFEFRVDGAVPSASWSAGLRVSEP